MAKKKKRWILTILALLSLSAVQAQERTLTRYEYWIDNIETLFTSGDLNGQSEQTLQLAIDPAGCNEGLHHFYCRFQDSGGKWSTLVVWPFYVRALPKNDVVKIVKAEYWIDSNDRKELTVDGTQLAFTVDAAGESEGMHTLNYRLLNNEGRYSPMYTWVFIREKLRDESIDNRAALLEYWIDDISNGVQTTDIEGNEINFSVDASKLPLGLHSLNYRVKDVIGRYSMPKTWLFMREELRDESIDNKVATVEYWVDNIDNGVLAEAVTGSDISFSVNTSSLGYGLHTLVYRLKDVLGNYSTPNTWMFVKNKPTEGTNITWCKYWWNEHEELAVYEDVASEGSEYVFSRELTIPDYVMANADEDSPTATLHVMFGDEYGHISQILSTVVSYTPIVFKIEPNELQVLKNLHARFNGEAWNHHWTFADDANERTDFPGVTFGEADELGYSHVVEIKLESNNLKGDVSNYALELPQLKSLNLYGNELSGDLTTFVSKLTNLKTLDVRANLLSGLSSLPSSVTTLAKGMQFQKDNATEYMADVQPVAFCIGNNKTVMLPGIMTYDLASHSHKPTLLYIMETGDAYSQSYLGQLLPEDGSSMEYETVWNTSPYTYTYPQKHGVWLRSADGTVYPAEISYIKGDADMSGYTDVLDVQSSITEILNPAVINLFNKSAANTYEDDVLNVQDVVCTVNIVLDDEPVSPSSYSVRRRTNVIKTASNWLYVDGERLHLRNGIEVGAIDVTLAGVSVDEVSLLLNRKDFQITSRNTPDGSRHIIYSLTGKTIPAGTTALIRLGNSMAMPVEATLTTPDAKALDVTLSSAPTAINQPETETPHIRSIDSRLVVSLPHALDNVKVSVIHLSGVRVAEYTADRLEAGETAFDAGLTSGVFVVTIESNGKTIGKEKLIKH